MAANEIIYLPYQPVSMYLVNPSATEIEEGYTSWATTAYHKRQGDCFFLGIDYCTPVNKETDKLTFQFKAKTADGNVVLPLFNPYLTGNNTSVTANKLVDSGAPFGSVSLNQLVQNLDDNTASYISNIDSTSVLTMEQDIFLASPRIYGIYAILVNANFRYFPLTDEFTVSTAASGNYIEYPGVLTLNKWYKVTIKITDITSGSLAVKLGSNTIATLTSVGEHVIYGQCLTTTSVIVEGSSSFVGSYDGLAFDVHRLVTEYNVVLFDKETELYVDHFTWDESSDSLTIGNIFVNIDWDSESLNPACGNYVIGITDEQICNGDIVHNGTFSSSVGWELDTNITISSGFLRFDGVTGGTGAINNLLCPIKEGLEYTVSWKIGYMPGPTKEGGYIFTTAEGNVSPVYNATVQVPGVYTFTFTATADSNVITIKQYGPDPSTFTIDNFSVTVEATADIADMNGLSECLCVCTNDCTALIEYKSNRPTFGSYFDNSAATSMQYRIPGRTRNTVISDLELNSFKTSLDEQIQPYNNLNRIEELATQPMPEYAHNTLAVALSHPNVEINGVKYIRTGSYAPDWGNDEVASVVVNVARRNQKYLRNNY
jgi:hypothetical protein